MDKHKCKFCEKQIHIYDIRCEKCNLIWNSGFKSGEDSIKNELSFLVTDFKKLIEKGVVENEKSI